MNEIAAGTGVDAAGITLAHSALPDESVLAGSPTTAQHALAPVGVAELGIWEMTAGTASDVEVDEVFVVISGRATISFQDSELPDLEVGPGSVARLGEGMRTVWTVTETLRKVYIA